ncbi:MAG: sigma-54-dependent Fis family transcriptional regulator [Candidatus Hydrothermota bacterium]|nr:MAG: sigma-54-dependent Fis family transcriptional regulator [Candidatus Hydrothermae bacterium]
MSDSRSLLVRGIRSILAVPLFVKEKLTGLIYLESGTKNLFVGEDLEFLKAFANIIGVALENAEYFEDLERENRDLKARLGEGDIKIIGRSPLIKRAVELADLYASSRAPILLTGPSGSGKELLARYIHKRGNYAGKFVPQNCGAIPSDLLESELFGYKRGAFTGATADKKGLIEEAKEGVLFLDEIGELPLQLQVKLLRFLQDGEFRRIGDNRVRKVRTRIIAATNRDLEKMVKEGKFREDLYFRISVLRIDLPALADRKEDIPILTNYLIRKFSRSENKRVQGIEKEALDRLIEYDWPGNIRQLENVILRAVISARGEYIKAEDISFFLEVGSGGRRLKTLEDMEKEYVREVLKMVGGNKTKAAEILGITTRGLQYKLKRWGF